MAEPVYDFPDVERVFVALLEQNIVGEGHAGAEVPADLDSRLPFVRVRRVDGPSDRLNDYARVVLDTFDVTDAAVQPLAGRIREYVTGEMLRNGRQVIDRVLCERGPSRPATPHSPTIPQRTSTYRVVSRRYRLTP